MQKPKVPFTIWNAAKPIYWTLKIFGLAIYSIEGDIANGKIKTNILDVVHLLLVLVLQLYDLYINVTVDLSLSRTNKFLIDRGAHAVEIFNAINVLMGTCIYSFYRKRVWRIFQKCNQFDEEVSNVNGKSNLYQSSSI